MVTLKEHNDRLKSAGLPSVEALTRRVLKAWDSATASDIEAGAVWYRDAQILAADLAGESVFDVEETAGIIAALSPRTFWSRNVVAAVAAIHGEEKPSGIIGRNWDTAMRIVEGESVDNVVKGPKTRAFAANIAGDTSRVTVDIWALRAVGLDESALNRKGIYDAIEAAYVRAATMLGVEPATCQATAWVVTRRVGLSEQRKRRHV